MGQTYIYVKNKSFQRLGCLAENCLRSLEKLDPTRSWFWFQSSGQVCWSRLIQTFSTFFCVSEVPRKLAFNFRPPVTNGWDFSDGWSFYLIEYQTSSAITTLLAHSAVGCFCQIRTRLMAEYCSKWYQSKAVVGWLENHLKRSRHPDAWLKQDPALFVSFNVTWFIIFKSEESFLRLDFY